MPLSIKKPIWAHQSDRLRNSLPRKSVTRSWLALQAQQRRVLGEEQAILHSSRRVDHPMPNGVTSRRWFKSRAVDLPGLAPREQRVTLAHFLKNFARMSSCQNGLVHPPWVNPLSVSSCAPLGAWMIFSSDKRSGTTIFRNDVALRITTSRRCPFNLTGRGFAQ